MELALDLRTDLVAARADRWADSREDILWPRAKLPLHAQDGLRRDAAHCALPTAVRDADSPMSGVEQQDGRAVSKAEQERQSRLVRDQRIRLGDGVRIRKSAAAGIAAADTLYRLAVHLLRCHELRSVEAECREVAAAVFGDIGGIIPDMEAEVQ